MTPCNLSENLRLLTNGSAIKTRVELSYKYSVGDDDDDVKSSHLKQDATKSRDPTKRTMVMARPITRL